MLLRGSLVLSALVAPWTSVWAAADTRDPTLPSLTRDLERIESVREIKNIQRTFGQLAQYGKWDAMAALFSEQGVLRWRLKNGDSDNITAVRGPKAIENFLQAEAGKMDGIRPGSMHLLLTESPVISLSEDAQTANGRWQVLRFLGDGEGKSRIDGGTFENEYAVVNQTWKISLLRYYPLYAGDYESGWTSLSDSMPVIIPYHFTPDEVGKPLLPPSAGDSSSPHQLLPNSAPLELELEELNYRISQLNEEDEVRNLMHATGYYVDRRMWPDVIDLFTPNGTMSVDGGRSSSPPGAAGIQTALDRMGPEGLTRGIMNEHPIFGGTVEISPSGREATSRGLEIGMIGDLSARLTSWQFCVFRHTYVKDAATGIWKIQDLSYNRLVFDDYAAGWGTGGTLPPRTSPAPPLPAFLDILARSWNTSQRRRPEDWQPFWRDGANSTQDTLNDLRRRLSRSAAFDETENVSSAYGFFLDDATARCPPIAALFAAKGFEESSGVGWYQSPGRIAKACTARRAHQTGSDAGATRNAVVSFHWRMQPVIHVSHDGRSTSLRTRDLQIGVLGAKNGTQTSGLSGGMYHDQLVLEQTPQNGKTARRKFWCVAVDEHYWKSLGGWKGGLAGIDADDTQPNPLLLEEEVKDTSDFPPDVSLKDPALGHREVGFTGGPTTPVVYPDIQRMWWSHRNPASGHLPGPNNSYWGPGCVPCTTARPEWLLAANGYQEPPTGPTHVTVVVKGGNLTITITGGPKESAAGAVEVRRQNRSANLVGFASLDAVGRTTVQVAVESLPAGGNQLDVYFLGSESLNPGKATVWVDNNSSL
ncbi:hypothetical protein B0H63DRAFT_431942 [Podospora didyma]|uniref:SnoaL-like domain-containing protein n=1 Tax=Podospora didyma TaxID=330526 RepID=A0AAE0NV28_9PEZI|nr:hypothetical protein B0H63DRAFT_431942 [Podospora didyma]